MRCTNVLQEYGAKSATTTTTATWVWARKRQSVRHALDEAIGAHFRQMVRFVTAVHDRTTAEMALEFTQRAFPLLVVQQILCQQVLRATVEAALDMPLWTAAHLVCADEVRRQVSATAPPEAAVAHKELILLEVPLDVGELVRIVPRSLTLVVLSQQHSATSSTNHQSPITNNQQPTTNNQQPTTNSQFVHASLASTRQPTDSTAMTQDKCKITNSTDWLTFSFRLEPRSHSIRTAADWPALAACITAVVPSVWHWKLTLALRSNSASMTCSRPYTAAMDSGENPFDVE